MKKPSKKQQAERFERARKWVELAIATGHDPFMIERSGKWGLQLRQPRASGQPITSTEELPPMPRRELWDELFQVCESLGRTYHIKEEAAS